MFSYRWTILEIVTK